MHVVGVRLTLVMTKRSEVIFNAVKMNRTKSYKKMRNSTVFEDLIFKISFLISTRHYTVFGEHYYNR